jgi:hypothetical protein
MGSLTALGFDPNLVEQQLLMLTRTKVADQLMITADWLGDDGSEATNTLPFSSLSNPDLRAIRNLTYLDLRSLTSLSNPDLRAIRNWRGLTDSHVGESIQSRPESNPQLAFSGTAHPFESIQSRPESNPQQGQSCLSQVRDDPHQQGDDEQNTDDGPNDIVTVHDVYLS